MATANPIAFLLNQSKEAAQSEVVAAPAFSLTKVLATLAAVVAPIATVVVDKLDEGLKAQHYVVLAVALLGFLAIITAADVLARAVATSAEKKAAAAAAGMGHATRFARPLKARRIIPHDEDTEVTVLAAVQADKTYFLVKEDESLEWLPSSQIRT
jgi:hypothetical protein